jgi:hypothetical protein
MRTRFPFEQAVEPVGPEMRAACRVDQLRGDAHPVSAFAHRAFQDIADAELAADLLHIDDCHRDGAGRRRQHGKANPGVYRRAP